jgi:hypothetical protein
VQTGLDTTVAGTGWGAGTWSRGAWGSGATLTAIGDTLRIWSHDNFGEDLIINIRNGGIYYWDKSTSSAPFARAVALSDLAGRRRYNAYDSQTGHDFGPRQARNRVWL